VPQLYARISAWGQRMVVIAPGLGLGELAPHEVMNHEAQQPGYQTLPLVKGGYLATLGFDM